MDLGVGSFVFSQGVVAVQPMLKDSYYLASSTVPKAVESMRKIIPIIFLGAIRVIAVKGTDYPVSILICRLAPPSGPV
jgi:phosphatidylinositol glycan class W